MLCVVSGRMAIPHFVFKKVFSVDKMDKLVFEKQFFCGAEGSV